MFYKLFILYLYDDHYQQILLSDLVFYLNCILSEIVQDHPTTHTHTSNMRTYSCALCLDFYHKYRISHIVMNTEIGLIFDIYHGTIM